MFTAQEAAFLHRAAGRFARRYQWPKVKELATLRRELEEANAHGFQYIGVSTPNNLIAVICIHEMADPAAISSRRVAEGVFNKVEANLDEVFFADDLNDIHATDRGAPRLLDPRIVLGGKCRTCGRKHLDGREKRPESRGSR